ncbi:MAG: hypothetical protein ACTSUM_01195 [Alphaproteobacteria bacterium]
MRPIFPFKVNIENHPHRRTIRVLRAISYFVAILFTITSLIAFGFLVIKSKKNVSPQFIYFDAKTKLFSVIKTNKKQTKNLKTARNVLREVFAKDYLTQRENWYSQTAKNHHRFCDCKKDEREISLIKKTRNRVIVPRCSVCLMSSEEVYKNFRAETYLARKNKSLKSWTQKPVFQNITLYKTIPPERDGTIYIYKINYKIKNQDWIGFVSLRDLKSPQEYLFRVVDYGVMKK